MPSRKPQDLSQAMAQAQASHDAAPSAVFWDADQRGAYVVLRHQDGDHTWRVGFRLVSATTHTGEWHAVEFAVQQAQTTASSALTGRTIRSLPIGELLSAARQAATEQGPGKPQDRQGKGRHLVRPSDARLAPFKTDARGKAPRSDDAYAALALEYALRVQEGDRSPVKALAAEHGGSPGTWANRVAEARKRGLLTPVKSGEAGGGLTDKALHILEGK